MTNKKQWLDAERKYHDDNAPFYVEKYGVSKKHQIPEEIFLLRYLWKKPAQKVVIADVACGPSLFISQQLKKHDLDCSYIGVDLSEALIKVAKQNFPQGYFVVADASDMPLQERCADFVVSLGGLHHVPDLYATIEGLFKILKPSGYLIMREPSPEAFEGSWKGESPMERGISPQEVIEQTKKMGGEIISYKRFNSHCFYKFQRLLHITRLYRFLEWSDMYWKIKTQAEAYMSYALGNRYPFYKGLDFSLVIKKT